MLPYLELVLLHANAFGEVKALVKVAFDVAGSRTSPSKYLFYLVAIVRRDDIRKSSLEKSFEKRRFYDIGITE